MLRKFAVIIVILGTAVSCISTKSSIKNIDYTAIKPVVKDNAYILKETAKDHKYGYNPDYPINIGYIMESNESKFIGYYFNALQGPEGQPIEYKKVETCCPFPTKNNKVGAGMLMVYEVKWEGQNKEVRLYFNTFERGKIMCPKGFTIKNDSFVKQ